MNFCQKNPGEQDIVVRIGRAASNRDISDVVADIAASLGFQHWFVRSIPVGGQSPGPENVAISNMRPDVAASLDRVFGHRDIGLMSRIRGLFSPSSWHISSLDRTASAENEAIWTVLHDAGMDYGVCFPALDIAGGGRVICFSGVRDPLSDDDIEGLDYLVFQIHGRISSLNRPSGDIALQLSEIEIHYLSLLAAGSSYDTISEAMGISTRTVQQLNISICRKMNVGSMEHAVAVALRNGMIT